jgi:ribosomal-protein-alanine N-acetyltransferase
LETPGLHNIIDTGTRDCEVCQILYGRLKSLSWLESLSKIGRRRCQAPAEDAEVQALYKTSQVHTLFLVTTSKLLIALQEISQANMAETKTTSKQHRLSLRPRRESDAEALFPTMSHPDSMQYWSSKPFTDISDVRKSFAETDNESSSWKCWAITKLDSDKAIGFVAASIKRKGVSEIGYMVAREELGCGYGRDAVGILISQLFGEGQRRVFADVDPDNRASIKLLEMLGFQLEGRLRAEWETHIGIRDSLIYGLLAEEWKNAE